MAKKLMGVKITGIQLTKSMLKGKNKQVIMGIDKGIHDAGFFVEAKVKDSIAGRNAEPKSVDTGNFMRSVQTDNTKKFTSIVKSDVEYGPALEFGTSRGISPRRHFGNTAKREKETVNQFILNKIR